MVYLERVDATPLFLVCYFAFLFLQNIFLKKECYIVLGEPLENVSTWFFQVLRRKNHSTVTFSMSESACAKNYITHFIRKIFANTNNY